MYFVLCVIVYLLFFFFKQKTAYEMRISDWSSDVCSSDLLGYVAFFAVGAYSYALLAQYYDASFWLCLPFAGMMAASFGIVLGFPVLRLRGDYLAIVTLGFGEIIRIVLLNWWWFTGGPNGIGNIDRKSTRLNSSH